MGLSECCRAEVIERSYPSLLLSRPVFICSVCGQSQVWVVD